MVVGKHFKRYDDTRGVPIVSVVFVVRLNQQNRAGEAGNIYCNFFYGILPPVMVQEFFEKKFKES